MANTPKTSSDQVYVIQRPPGNLRFTGWDIVRASENVLVAGRSPRWGARQAATHHKPF